MVSKAEEDEWIKSHFVGNGTRPGHNHSHWNRWCMACLDARVRETADEKVQHYETHELNVLRSEGNIREQSMYVLPIPALCRSHVMAVMANPTTMSPKPISSKLYVLVNHLLSCINVRDTIRFDALAIKGRRSNRTRTNKENQMPSGPTPVLPPLSHSPMTHTPGRLSIPGLLVPTPSSSAAQREIPLRSSLVRSFSQTSFAMDSDCLAAEPASKRHCSSLLEDGNDTYGTRLPHVIQCELEKDILKLCASGSIAFRAVELPYWRRFFSKWIPGSRLPTRQALSGRILDKEAHHIVDDMKMQLSGWYGTGQSDGWRNVTKTSIIVSLINTEYEVRMDGTYHLR